MVYGSELGVSELGLRVEPCLGFRVLGFRV